MLNNKEKYVDVEKNGECQNRSRKEQERQGVKQTPERPNTNLESPKLHCQGTTPTAERGSNGPKAATQSKSCKTEN